MTQNMTPDYTKGMCNGEIRGIVKEPKSKILTPEDVRGYVKSIISSTVEHAVALPLDDANHVLGAVEVSKGCTDSTCVSLPVMFRLIFSKRKYATATSFILVHNHPSGNPNPSSEDLKLTQKAVFAGKVLDFHCIDHIVFGRYGAYTSIRRQNQELFA